MTLNAMRALVRRELHDEDPNAYRWSNTELDRHLQHAVSELSIAVPLEASATLTTSASRDLSLSGLSGLIRAEAAEYPVGQYPPAFVPFSHWGQTLTLLVDKVPASGESVRLYYVKGHTLDATTSTVPSHLADVVVLGASAFAALEWAGFGASHTAGGDPDAARQALTWSKGRLAAFQRSLDRLAAGNTVRARHLYVAAAPKATQSTDWGP